MNNCHFVREGISRPLRSAFGDSIDFTDIGDDTGILTTNNAILIAELRAMIARARGGVREVSDSAEFEALKKKASEGQQRLNLLLANARPKPRIDRLDQPAKSAAAVNSPRWTDPSTGRSGADTNAGHPLEVPSEIPLPKSLQAAKKPVAKKAKAEKE
jgi:hypothetical protein